MWMWLFGVSSINSMFCRCFCFSRPYSWGEISFKFKTWVHFWSLWWYHHFIKIPQNDYVPLKRDRNIILQKERIVFAGSTLSYKPCRYRRCMALYTSAYPFCYVLKSWSSTAFAYVPLKHHQNMWIFHQLTPLKDLLNQQLEAAGELNPSESHEIPPKPELFGTIFDTE